MFDIVSILYEIMGFFGGLQLAFPGLWHCFVYFTCSSLFWLFSVVTLHSLTTTNLRLVKAELSHGHRKPDMIQDFSSI